jgi:hypothetical protein
VIIPRCGPKEPSPRQIVQRPSCGTPPSRLWTRRQATPQDGATLTRPRVRSC